MPRYRAFFSPYFTSQEFQKSNERKIEKAIEDRWHSILFLITKVWKHSPNKIEHSTDHLKEK